MATLDRVSLTEDLLAEGAPEVEFNPGIAARLPRKRTAAGALIRDHSGRVLFVVPNYKPWLDIPGGIVDEGESPQAACTREVQEETGLVLPVGPLLVVDWVPPHGVWGDGLMFVFDGGVIHADQLAAVVAADSELDGLTLLHLHEAGDRLGPSQRRRLRAAVEAAEAGHPRYVEFGRRP